MRLVAKLTIKADISCYAEVFDQLNDSDKEKADAWIKLMQAKGLKIWREEDPARVWSLFAGPDFETVSDYYASKVPTRHHFPLVEVKSVNDLTVRS